MIGCTRNSRNDERKIVAAYGSVPESYPIVLRADPLVLLLVVLAAVGVFAVIVATVRAPARLAPLMREDE